LARQSKHPEGFRRQAAALVLDSGRTIRDVARELGVNHETLRNWVDKLRQERAGRRPGELGSEERAELVRLRRQVAQLELEKEILKKPRSSSRARRSGEPHLVYEFIAAEKTSYPVRLLCRLLGVGHSAFYDWLRTGRQRAADRHRHDQARAAIAHQNRTRAPAGMAHPRRRPAGPIRVHRRLVQHPATALHPRLPQPSGLRSHRDQPTTA
jgi:transposase